VVGRAAAATAAGRPFTLALSGGSTPLALYRLLAGPAGERLPWPAVHVFWGDERAVPPGHPDSNYRAARETLLDHVPLPPANVHRVPTEGGDPARAAAAYAAELRRFFGLARGGWPRFELVLLGLGADGHTASLFPGSAVLGERRRLVAAPWVEGLGAFRVTLTPPVFNHARAVAFLVSGAAKAASLVRALAAEGSAEETPARLIRPRAGELLWLVDRAAARRLPGEAADGPRAVGVG
jgi:6-phosphogluconolactonase